MQREKNRKSIAIIGEGETEWFYFESLRIAKHYPFKMAPDFPQHSDVHHFIKLINKYVNEQQYDYVICLFDMDRLLQHPTEMKMYKRAKKTFSQKKYAKQVMFIETNPCTEFWFLLHFLPQGTCRKFNCYEQLLPELQRYMPRYEKTKRYFERAKLYEYLTANGNINLAMANAKYLCELSQKSPHDHYCYSEIHKVFQKIEEVLKNKK